jgi:hypothetical protein
VHALLERGPARAAGTTRRAKTRDQRRAQPERAIICRRCAHLITHARHRIAMQGRHRHRFMNPAGILFVIGCFAEAVGCVTVGPASHEYPWFAGFAWRCAYCAGCASLLGWQFRNDAGAAFFGLILDRLTDAPAADDRA